jgi:hypothetical protein
VLGRIVTATMLTESQPTSRLRIGKNAERSEVCIAAHKRSKMA